MFDISRFAPYMKAIGAFMAGLATVAAVVVSVASDGNVSGPDIAAIISSIAGVLGSTGAVYQLTNTPKGK